MKADKTKSYLNRLLNIKTRLEIIGIDMSRELEEMFDCVIEYNNLSIQNDILERKCKFYEDTYLKKLINERFGAPK